MDQEYGRRYRELYERHWWWKARERFVLDTIQRARPTDRPERILDVGCGDGLFFDRLIELGEVHGLEPAGELLDPAGKHRHRIRVGPFDETFEPGMRYSLVLMLDVLEHLPDPVGALRRAWSLLDEAGILVVTVPAFNLLWTHHDVLNHHYTRYTRRMVLGIAGRAGVPMCSVRYFFHWLFPAKLLARAAEAVVGVNGSGPGIPPSWLNRGLYYISRVEQAFTRVVPLPFGSSLIAVARKPVTSGARV